MDYSREITSKMADPIDVSELDVTYCRDAVSCGMNGICCRHCDRVDTCEEACTEFRKDEACEMESSKEYIEMLQDSYIKDLIHATAEVEKWKEQVDNLKEEISRTFMILGKNTYKDDQVSITKTKDGQRVSVDSKKLKTEFPEVYEACSKTSVTKGSLRVKLNG